MKRILLFLLLVCCVKSTYSQKITVESNLIEFDSITGIKLLPYVNVYLNNGSNGTITNSRGYFKLDLASEKQNDTLIFSKIGYEIEKIIVKEITNKIILKRKTTNLPEFEVISSNEKLLLPSKLGIDEKGNAVFFQNVGGELGIKIYNDHNEEKLVSNFNFNVSNNKGYNAPFRVYFYSIKNNFPDTLIYENEILIKANKKNWNKIDISNHKIILQPKQEYLVSIEWIYSNDDFFYWDEKKQKKYKEQMYGPKLKAIQDNDIQHLTYIRKNKGNWSLLKFKHLNGESFNALIFVECL
jgi:hypothetical protein